MKRRRTALFAVLALLALAAVFGKTFVEFANELKNMASEIASVKEKADSDANAAGVAQALAVAEVGRYVSEIESQMQEDATNEGGFKTEYDSKYAEVNNSIAEAERAAADAMYETFSESDYSKIEEALASSINPVPTPSDGLVKIKDIYDRYRVFKDGEGMWHVDVGVVGCDGDCEKELNGFMTPICSQHVTDEYAIQQLTILAKHIAIARKMGIIFRSDMTGSTIPQ